MVDTRFHDRLKSFSAKQIAEITGATIASGGYEAVVFDDVTPLDKAGSANLSFLDNVKYKDDFANTKAGACFVSENMSHLAPDNVCLFITPTPYKAYALAARAFYPEENLGNSIDKGAYVSDEAVIDDNNVVVEAGAVIKDGVQIGAGCWIEAGAVIGKNVVVGQNCRIGTNASISHSIIGDNVRIYPGCCIGQDGFGFAIDTAGYIKVPQLGRVIIEDGVEIGANTTIDRGSGPDTIIGAGSWLDNLVQIGHNVKIGKCCVIVSQVGVAGSTVLDDFVMMGGQVGIAGHLKIGKGAKIAAKSGVTKNVAPGAEMMGYPAVPIKQFMRQIVHLNRLIKKKK